MYLILNQRMNGAAHPITIAARLAADMGHDLYMVGGVVRAILVAGQVKDVDLAIDGDAGDFGLRLAEALGAMPPKASGFGTVSVVVPTSGVRFDIAQLRTERYPRPGVLPDVSPTSSINTDLARRDFTVNAIAIMIAGANVGAVYDPFDGVDDLMSHTLRSVNKRSYRDDPTRIIRAASLMARFRFNLDDAEDLDAAREHMGSVSGRRILDALETGFEHDGGSFVYRLDRELNVLEAIVPEFDSEMSMGVGVGLDRLTPGDAVLGLLACSKNEQVVLERFPFDREQKTVLHDLFRLKAARTVADIFRLANVSETALNIFYEGRFARDAVATVKKVRAWKEACAQVTGDVLIKKITSLNGQVPAGAAFGNMLEVARRQRYHVLFPQD